MSIDLEELKRELEQISPWPWTMTQNAGWGAAIWDSGKNILFRVERNSLDASKTSEDCPMPLWKRDTSFARKSPEIIAALIEEVERYSPSFDNSFRRANPPAGAGLTGRLSGVGLPKTRPAGVSVSWECFAWIITIFLMVVAAGYIAYLIGQEWV